jgi:hypothetical protein
MSVEAMPVEAMAVTAMTVGAPSADPVTVTPAAMTVGAPSATATRICRCGSEENEPSHDSDGDHPLHELLPSVPGRNAPRARYPE